MALSEDMNRQSYELIARSLAAGELADKNWQLVPSSTSARVAKSIDTKTGKMIYCKVFLPRSVLERLKQVLRGSRAKRATDNATLLEKLGFNTPKVLGSGTSSHYSWLATEGVNAVGLGDYADKCLRGKLSPTRLQWKREIITALATLLGQLHKQGVIHGDLRLNNILIDTQKKSPYFYLVDNERNKYFSTDGKKIPEELIIKNLVQVALLFPPFASKTDRCRFINVYREVLDIPFNEQFSEMMESVHTKITGRLDKLSQKPAWQNSLDPTTIGNLPD